MNLKRPLRGSETGADVRMVQRALNRWSSQAVPIPTDGKYGQRTSDRMVAFQLAEKISPARGDFGQMTLDKLWPYFDRYGRYRYRLYRPPRPTLPMLSPVTVGRVPSFLHPTAGLLGNYALDWMGPGGTPVFAPEDAKIKKLSGRDPRLGADQVIGIFGWSIHFETFHGYRYFATHFGERENLAVGQSVKAGQKLGEMGHWPGDPGRSHLHLGVTSPLGTEDAKKRIKQVAAAPRLADL